MQSGQRGFPAQGIAVSAPLPTIQVTSKGTTLVDSEPLIRGSVSFGKDFNQGFLSIVDRKNMVMAHQSRTVIEVSVDDVEKRRRPRKHYVYIITVTWSDDTVSVIYRRYSKFFDLQIKLLDKYPTESGDKNPADRILPFLPGKILFGRSHIREVALKRLEPINSYCKQLIGLPRKISQCKEVLDFFEPRHEDLVPPRQQDSVRETWQGAEISEPSVLEHYLAVADYKKLEPRETSLTAGETVDVIEKNRTGWWLVSADSGQGWVPSSYLERPEGIEDNRMVNSLSAKPYVSIESYEPNFSDELRLAKGAVVQILQKNLDGWWFGRCNGKTGLVPACFLARTDTKRAKLLGKTPQTAVEVVPNRTAVSNNHTVTSQPTSPSNPLSMLLAEVTSRKARGSQEDLPRDLGVPADPPAPPVQPRNAVGGERWGGVGPPTPQFAAVTPTTPSPHVHAAKLKAPHPTSQTPSAFSNMGYQYDDFDEDEDDSDSLQSYHRAPPRARSIKRLNSIHPPEEDEDEIDYVTIAQFSAQAGDCLTLVEGQRVKVLEKSESGWWLVQVDGCEGWAPASYIEKKAIKRTSTPAPAVGSGRADAQPSRGAMGGRSPEPPGRALAGVLKGNAGQDTGRDAGRAPGRSAGPAGKAAARPALAPPNKGQGSATAWAKNMPPAPSSARVAVDVVDSDEEDYEYQYVYEDIEYINVPEGAGAPSGGKPHVTSNALKGHAHAPGVAGSAVPVPSPRPPQPPPKIRDGGASGLPAHAHAHAPNGLLSELGARLQNKPLQKPAQKPIATQIKGPGARGPVPPTLPSKPKPTAGKAATRQAPRATPPSRTVDDSQGEGHGVPNLKALRNMFEGK